MHRAVCLAAATVAAFTAARLLRHQRALRAFSKKSSAASVALVTEAGEQQPDKKDVKEVVRTNCRYVNTFTKDTLPGTLGLYPMLEPYNTGFLPVGDGHELYYEESGNPEGKPVVVLHGGPGGGCAPWYRRFFDPKAYRIIMFDQRGAGKSIPNASLVANTTWHLVADIEKLRVKLGVDRWVVFGGSWGSCLALAYAETHTDRVKALILRGIFTIRRKELVWFYQGGAYDNQVTGADFLFPEYWEPFVAPIPPAQRGDMMSAYYLRLTGEDEAEKVKCALAWTRWEMATCHLYVDHEEIEKGEDEKFAVAFARIECHYFVHGAWLKNENQLIDDASKLSKIPGVIVQGRYDSVCPATSAWDLHKKWENSELIMVQDAGHSASEPGIISELVRAADKYRDL